MGKASNKEAVLRNYDVKKQLLEFEHKLDKVLKAHQQGEKQLVD